MKGIALVVILFLGWTVKAEPTTIGCVSSGILGGLLGALLGGTFNRIPSASVCAARCDSINRQFSYWSSGLSQCYCANTGVNINQLTTSAETVAGSTSAPFCSAFQYHVQTSGYDYELQACAAPSSITGVTIPPSAPRTVNQCLDYCQSQYSYALVTLGSTGTCTCAKGVTVASAGLGVCARGRVAVYRNLGIRDPAPSGMKKKRRFAKDKRLCPGRLDACLIEGQGGDSFECLDSQVELESCGGCLHGAVDSILDPRRGIDCSAIPGVALGGVTCEGGRCIVSKCKSGFIIAGDRCIRRV